MIFLKNKYNQLLEFIKIDNFFFVFIIVWVTLNCIQAYITPMHFDETYYWIYSRKLSWGYFDHPPIVSFLCFLGYGLFENEFGLRFFHIILSTGTVYILIRIAQQYKKDSLILLVFLSFPLSFFHLGGFLAIPDTSLIFFSTLFLYHYKEFTTKQTFSKSVFLGITGALMILSKYHGGLFLLLIFLSNIKLIKNRHAWVSVFIIIFLLTPHLLWQYDNNFPSIKYHFYDRVSGFNYKFVLNYIGSQILFSGIFSGLISISLLFSFRPTDDFQRALKYIPLGFLFFFLIMSFRDDMEAHWTAVAMPSMILIVFIKLQKRPKKTKRFIKLAVPGIMFVFLFRIFLLDIFPSFGLKDFMETKRITETNFCNKTFCGPVVVGNSYKVANILSFNERKIVPFMPFYFNRYSQWDLMHYEDELIGETVLIVTPDIQTPDITDDCELKLYSFVVEDFVSYRNISFKSLNFINSQNDTVIGVIKNNSLKKLSYTRNKILFPFFHILNENNESIFSIPVYEAVKHESIKPGEEQEFSFIIPECETQPKKIQIRFYMFRGEEKDINTPIQ